VSFVSALALLVSVFVAAPVAAHLFRRRRSQEEPFAAVALVEAAAPEARTRSRLEDRGLLLLRALSVLALAVLGATPLVRCARLGLARSGGASVAVVLVVDDSLGMQAPLGKASRFERAKAGATELLGDLGPGDSVAVVMAGRPARIELGTTTDLALARRAVSALEPSDRGTDLESALALARELALAAPQADRRVVLLSDRAGKPGAPLTTGDEVALSAPLDELAGPVRDCAVLSAARVGARVRARVACTGDDGAPRDAALEGPRELVLWSGGERIASEPLASASAGEVSVLLPAGREGLTGLRVALAPGDAIASDDAAWVAVAAESRRIGVVADAARGGVQTGGPPLVEQALTALELKVEVRALPSVPDEVGDLDGLAGLVLDDVPGLTPEARRAVGQFVERGGAVLSLLGPAAASAPLGSGWAPLVPGVVRFAPDEKAEVDVASAAWLGATAPSLEALEPVGRVELEPQATEGAEVLARWRDGRPLLVRRALGRGTAWTLTLPASLEVSELAVRPAFLALLERFAVAASAGGGELSVEVGQALRAPLGLTEARLSVATSPSAEPRALVIEKLPEQARVVTAKAGAYELALGEERSLRTATLPADELDFRAREVATSERSGAVGKLAQVDLSPYVALALLALLAGELVLRVLAKPREEEDRTG
jgi:hypothetical protein